MRKSIKILNALNDIDSELLKYGYKNKENSKIISKIALCSSLTIAVALTVVVSIDYLESYKNKNLFQNEDIQIASQNNINVENSTDNNLDLQNDYYTKANDFIKFNEGSINNESRSSIDGLMKNSDLGLEFDFINRIKVPSNYNLYKQGKLYIRENPSDVEYSKLRQYEVIYSQIEDKSEYIEIIFTKEDSIIKCIMPIDDNFEYSVINGYSIKLFHTGMVYESYFEYNGYKFYIEAYKISENDYIELLRSILV